VAHQFNRYSSNGNSSLLTPTTPGHMNDTASKILRITLVDDDASVRSAVSRLLRSNDYTCKTYESAESALADPDFSSADCLVLDVQLSGMNGFALRDRLREMGSPTPCLFITAHPETGSLEWQQAVGDSPCLTKPFEEAQLFAAIDGLLNDRNLAPTQ
jgi:FixJ family two-component response regulator